MTDWSEKFAEELDDLRRVRDELRVQIHLGKAEAKAQWDELEKRFQQLESRAKLVRDESAETLDDIGDAARGLVDEIKRGYRHLRDLL